MISRKFVLLNEEVAGAINHFSNNEFNCLERQNMQMYILKKFINEKKTNVSKSTPFDNSSLLMKMISNLMMNVQQKSLNAKHVASFECKKMQQNNISLESSGIKDFGLIPDNIYISINKSCYQRKNMEFCGIFNSKILQNCQKFFSALRIIPYKNINFPNNICVYLITTKKLFLLFLQKLEPEDFPTMIFTSLKNFVSFYDEKTFLSNYLLYHIFHECNRSFDLRQIGAKWRDLIMLYFFLGLINRHMLKISAEENRLNLNLAANSQSLGKALNNPVFQLFSENSIPTISKIESSSFETDIAGILVNRSCGVVSQIGINDISLSYIFKR